MRLTTLLGVAGFIAAVVASCQSPESFHKKGDGGLITGSGGATIDTGDATAGSGGAPTGGDGDPTGSGGASFASGGSTETGGSEGATGGAPGQGGAVASGGRSATGGATASGGAASGGAGVGGIGGTGAASAGAGGAPGEGGSTSMTCSSCSLTVNYLPIGTTDSKSIVAEVHIATTTVVPINRVTVRYWYTNETGSSDITTEIDYVGLSTGSALPTPSPSTTSTTSVVPPRTNASTVTSITIPETTLLRPGTQLFIKFRIHQTNYSGTFMVANDYSFGANQTLAMPWPKITAYVGGIRAWGSEPP